VCKEKLDVLSEIPDDKYAIQRLTSCEFAPKVRKEKIRLKTPEGETEEIEPVESYEVACVEPYWSNWRSYDDLDKAKAQVDSFLRTKLHNQFVERERGWEPSWEPIRLVSSELIDGFKQIDSWLTEEGTSKKLSTTPKEAFETLKKERELERK